MLGYSLETIIKKVVSTDEVEEKWRSLQSVSSEGPFTSWTWIGPWLENMIAKGKPVFLVEVCCEKYLNGLGILHITTFKRRRFFQRNIAFLNELPIENNNMVIEYNGLLVKKGFEKEVWSSFLSEVSTLPDWDELHLNAIAPHFADCIKHFLGSTEKGLYCQQHSYDEVYFADFANTQEWPDVPSLLLSKNKRAQIKRSLHGFQSKYGGHVQCELARTVCEALTYFQELENLHTAYWNSKNDDGAFANREWVEFNRSIIKQSISSGNVLLYRISAGSHTIGYLYNLGWRDTVYNIQSGFNYEVDNKLKSGFVSHWLAMQHGFACKFKKYNFLAGTTHYKKSLSNSSERIESFVVRKKGNSLQFLFEDMLVHSIRWVRKLTRK